MFCENCGTKLEDGTVFCTNCGAKQDVVPAVAPDFKPEGETPVTTVDEAVAATESAVEGAPEAAPSAQQAAPQFQQAPQQPYGQQPYAQQPYGQQPYGQPYQQAPKQNPLKKVPIWAWIIIAVVIIAGIVGFIFLNKRMHTIDINDYVTVEFNGYDTVGTATVVIDEDFWDEVYEKSSFKGKKKSSTFSSYYTEGEYMEEEIGGYIKYELDKDSMLTNGDEVKVEYKVKTDKIAKKYGVTIEAKDKTFKVADLEEVETFNPFDDIEITFTGVSGDGEFQYEVTNERDIYDDFSFSCDDDWYLEEGDTTTIKFAEYWEEDELIEYCAEEYGMIPTETEMEVTVEGLGSYVEDATLLTAANVADMDAEAQDEITTELDGLYADYDYTVNSMDYLGSYVVSDGTYGNYVYFVYKVNLDIEMEGESGSVEYYTTVEFSDVVANADGSNISYSYISGTPYNSYDFDIGGYYGYVYGYETLEDLQDEMSYYESYYDVTNNVSVSE